ncbi:penicillin-binding protein activator [Marinovum sp.]|uniref:penicillin-binding protein activator n=1 Tax=Marinovum sp. TaxID=2024839 RepID=UPI002B273991|nr:penicillin-binding protein activator [Marinovum sp.]
MFAVLSAARKRLRLPRFARSLAASVGLIALAACEPVQLGDLGGGGGQRIDTSQPVPVALLIPKSDAGAGAVARALENAARLAVADLGTVRIDLRVYDTAGNAATAAAQAQKAVDAGAKIILGPLFGEAANAVGVQVADDNVNVLSFSNNPSIAGGNVFVLGATFRNTANRLMGFAAEQGKQTVTVVYPNNVEGQFGKAAIEAAAGTSGIQVVASEGFDFSQQGVIAAMPRISAAARQSDAVFLTSNAAGALPLLVQLLPENGIGPDTTQYIGLGRWDVPAQTLALPGVQGGWFALPDQSRTASFTSRYQAAYGSAPHPLAGLGFDGIAAIGALVGAGKSDALTARALTQTSGFQGTGGVFRLLPDGTNERALAVATVRGNKVVILDPAPNRFGRAGF